MTANRILFRLLFLAFLAGALAHATLVPRMTLEQAVDDSELIVQGTVVRTWSAWGDKRQFIWTHYELKVSDALKGLATRNIVISEPGGTVGDTGMQIAGAPRYSVGEEVVLFATRTPIGYLRTAGLGSGEICGRGLQRLGPSGRPHFRAGYHLGRSDFQAGVAAGAGANRPGPTRRHGVDRIQGTRETVGRFSRREGGSLK